MFQASSLRKFDNHDMLSILLDFPNQLKIAEEIGQRFRPPKRAFRPKMILWCGMGGSAIGGDLIASYLKDRIDIPVRINRHYKIPSFVSKDVLTVISSYSGNTEETLSCYRQAKAKKATVFAITSGGRLADLAVKNRDMFIAIPHGLPPRCALGYLSIPVLVAFSRLGLIKPVLNEIDEAVATLRRQANRLRPKAGTRQNLAKRIALALHNKFPLIYASTDYFEPVCYRWRTQIAENAKMLSSNHLFAEMNHNEIEGFEPFSKVPGNIIAVILRDRADHPRVQKRMKITKDIMQRKKVKVLELSSLGKGLLARMLSVIYIGDWASYYLAILNKVDPTPVDRISYLKRRLVT